MATTTQLLTLVQPQRKSARGRECVKTRVRFRVRSILQIAKTKVVQNRIYELQKCSAKTRSTARVAFSHIHGRPCLPSAQFVSGKEAEIAAIHPDFVAAEPLSLMEFAGRVLISLTSFSLPV